MNLRPWLNDAKVLFTGDNVLCHTQECFAMSREPTVLDVANETPITFKLLDEVYALQASMSAEERMDVNRRGDVTPLTIVISITY